MLADRKRIYFSLLDIKRNNEKFSFTFNFIKTKPPIDFFAQNSVQFGRRAKRGDPQIVDFSLLAPELKLNQTFEIILPNLIHKSKKRNLT